MLEGEGPGTHILMPGYPATWQAMPTQALLLRLGAGLAAAAAPGSSFTQPSLAPPRPRRSAHELSGKLRAHEEAAGPASHPGAQGLEVSGLCWPKGAQVLGWEGEKFSTHALGGEATMCVPCGSVGSVSPPLLVLKKSQK